LEEVIAKHSHLLAEPRRGMLLSPKREVALAALENPENPAENLEQLWRRCSGRTDSPPMRASFFRRRNAPAERLHGFLREQPQGRHLGAQTDEDLKVFAAACAHTNTSPATLHETVRECSRTVWRWG
jgi:hypothetical protein